MSTTRIKLQEAKFFLEQLELHYFDYPIGNYYMSAYISSARSVLWVMKSEFNNVEGWQNWYDNKQPDVEENEILRGINSIRVRSEKIEPIKTSFQVVLNIPKENATPDLMNWFEERLGQKELLNITVNLQENEMNAQITMDDKQAIFNCKLEDVYRVVEEFPDTDILTKCKKYFEMLSFLVDECEQRFLSNEEK